MNEPYPDIIKDLPEIDLPIEGVVGHLLQAGDYQITFFEMEAGTAVPPHSHEAQWGIVIEGEMDITIGGVVHSLKQGDSYYIPAGVEHSAVFKTKFRAMDLFAAPDRYRAKTQS